MTIHALQSATHTDPYAEARIHLAAALRMAVLHELDEGIDNHFTVEVPGRSGQYLILPFGLHWSEARASDLIVFDEQGRVLDGQGTLQLSAQCIHATVHRLTGARVVLHDADLEDRRVLHRALGVHVLDHLLEGHEPVFVSVEHGGPRPRHGRPPPSAGSW